MVAPQLFFSASPTPPPLGAEGWTPREVGSVCGLEFGGWEKLRVEVGGVRGGHGGLRAWGLKCVPCTTWGARRACGGCAWLGGDCKLERPSGGAGGAGPGRGTRVGAQGVGLWGLWGAGGEVATRSARSPAPGLLSPRPLWGVLPQSWNDHRGLPRGGWAARGSKKVLPNMSRRNCVGVTRFVATCKGVLHFPLPRLEPPPPKLEVRSEDSPSYRDATRLCMRGGAWREGRGADLCAPKGVSPSGGSGVSGGVGVGALLVACTGTVRGGGVRGGFGESLRAPADPRVPHPVGGHSAECSGPRLGHPGACKVECSAEICSLHLPR